MVNLRINHAKNQHLSQKTVAYNRPRTDRQTDRQTDTHLHTYTRARAHARLHTQTKTDRQTEKANTEDPFFEKKNRFSFNGAVRLRKIKAKSYINALTISHTTTTLQYCFISSSGAPFACYQHQHSDSGTIGLRPLTGCSQWFFTKLTHIKCQILSGTRIC